MRLKAVAFSPNGRGDLVGTIIAYSDGDEPLGVEHAGNYSRQASKVLMAKLEAIGTDLEVAQAQLTRLLSELRSGADAAAEQPPPQRVHSLPVVDVAGRLREVVDDGWELLQADNTARTAPRWYRHGDVLAELKATTPRPVTLAALRIELDRLGDFEKALVDGRVVTARPPKDVLESMIAVVPDTMPRLVSVTRVPYLAPDGQIVATEGYDVSTGIYLAVDGLRVPTVPASPTEQQIAGEQRVRPAV